MKIFNNLSLISLISLTLLISSCEKDETPSQPDLPPQDAFIMDFSDFQNTPGEKKTLESTMSYQNFGQALANVAWWNTIVSVSMAVPAATYVAVLNDTAEYQGDNVWEWDLTVNVGSYDYTARLTTSRINNEEFSAEMYISLDGLSAFTEFKWFEGIIRYDRTHALWTLYESASNPVEIVEIEWNMDWEEEISDITYTYIKPDDPENGSYIKYEITNNSDYDARYTISGSEDTVNIEWSRETKAGRIKNLSTFGDELWHCWNELLEDVDCE